MATSLTWNFNQDTQGFMSYRDTSLERIKQHGNFVLMCKCLSQSEMAGALKPLNLSRIGTFTLSVTGSANNQRTYLAVTNSQYESLIEENFVYLTRELSSQEIVFQTADPKIRIGLLMGGDSIALPSDCFFVQEVTLKADFSWHERQPRDLQTLINRPLSQFYQSPPAVQSSQTTPSDLRITRVFETVSELERELEKPNRSNGTSMTIGEYAILKQDGEDHLYLLSQLGLKYVARIGSGLPTFLGEALHVPPGKILPIYNLPAQAQRDLNQLKEKFYHSRGSALWSSSRDEINENIYLYLDSDGYVRWLKYEENKSTVQNVLDLEEFFQSTGKK